MTGRFTHLKASLIAITLMAPLPPVLADDDHLEARHLQEAKEILSLEEILTTVRDTYPGRILEVELEKENGRILYEIEILGERGVVHEIYIDAKTGEQLLEQEDD